jgi:hypothetical protein
MARLSYKLPRWKTPVVEEWTPGSWHRSPTDHTAPTTTNSFSSVIGTGNNAEIGFSAANTIGIWAGTSLNTTASFPENSWHVINALYSGGSSVINADGT